MQIDLRLFAGAGVIDPAPDPVLAPGVATVAVSATGNGYDRTTVRRGRLLAAASYHLLSSDSTRAVAESTQVGEMHNCSAAAHAMPGCTRVRSSAGPTWKPTSCMTRVASGAAGCFDGLRPRVVHLRWASSQRGTAR